MTSRNNGWNRQRACSKARCARARGGRARFDPGWNDETVAEHIAEANRLRLLLNGPLRGDLALFDWLDGLPVASS
jgi:hypothetical protein